MGASLVAGRPLTARDSDLKLTPVLVNQEFVQEYHATGSPIGRHLTTGTGDFEIVGILGNVRGTAGSLAQATGAEVYFPADEGEGVVQRFVVVRSQLPPAQLTKAIERQVHEVDAQQAIRNVRTMDELVGASVAQPRLNMVLLGSFAGIALLLACVGIYGVVAYSVAQRKQEIGLRMALGATRVQISLLFIRRALVSALIGVTAGGLVSLTLTRLLRSELYGVRPDNPGTYLVSILVLLIPVLAATLRPALFAANVNPVDALRME